MEIISLLRQHGPLWAILIFLILQLVGVIWFLLRLQKRTQEFQMAMLRLRVRGYQDLVLYILLQDAFELYEWLKKRAEQENG